LDFATQHHTLHLTMRCLDLLFLDSASVNSYVVGSLTVHPYARQHPHALHVPLHCCPYHAFVHVYVAATTTRSNVTPLLRGWAVTASEGEE
jgi:hypothetical protein